MTEEYLDLIEKRFKREFPKSHLVISQEISIGYITTKEWTLFIKFREDESEETVFEQFKSFNDLDNRLLWHSFRMRRSYNSIKEETENTFEEYLIEKHAQQYCGLDDEMADNCNEWMQDLGIDEVIEYAEKWKELKI